MQLAINEKYEEENCFNTQYVEKKLTVVDEGGIMLNNLNSLQLPPQATLALNFNRV